MNEICIFIPTRNRPKCIEYFFENVGKQIKTHNISLYIYDTSSNELTKNAVNNSAKEGADVDYYLDNNYSDSTSDLKIFKGFSYLKNSYDYIWLLGDGLVPRMNEVFETLKNVFPQEPSIIHFYQKDDFNGFVDPSDFFRNNGWWATYYGMTIISSSVIDIALLEEKYDSFRNTGFLFWHYLFSSIAGNKNAKIYISSLKCCDNNPNKPLNSSYQKGAFLNFWANNWIKAVRDLPECYNDSKEKVIKDIGVNLHLYSINGLASLRFSGNLSFSLYKKYKKNLKTVSDTSLFMFFLVSICPRFILRILIKLKRLIRKKNQES